MKFLHQNKIIRFILIYLWPAFSASTFAGSYILTTSNYTTSGLTSDVSSGSLDASGGGFTSTTASPVTVSFSGFTIRKNYSWNKLSLQISGIGTITINVKEESGRQVYSEAGINATKTISLEQVAPETAKNGRPLVIAITISSNTVLLEKLTLSYNGLGLYGYPIPYIPSQGEFKILYDLPADGKVDLRIYDNRGILVKAIINNETKSAKYSPKTNIEKWDGKNERGNKVASGVYNAVIKVEFTSSSELNYTSVFRFVVLR